MIACDQAVPPIVDTCIAHRMLVFPVLRAISLSAPIAISPDLVQLVFRNCTHLGVCMFLSSHQFAKASSLSVPSLVMFLAAASVHCGGPPSSPVRLAFPARFVQGSCVLEWIMWFCGMFIPIVGVWVVWCGVVFDMVWFVSLFVSILFGSILFGFHLPIMCAEVSAWYVFHLGLCPISSHSLAYSWIICIHFVVSGVPIVFSGL